MKRTVDQIGGLIVAALILATAFPAFSEVKDNQYQVIIERNVFDVHAPPPPPQPSNEPPPPPPSKTVVKLTGITTLGGTAKALLEITPEPGKPAEKPILKVGERAAGVDLLEIDVANSTVKIRNGTAEFLVGFTNTPSAGAPAPNPGAVAMRPGMPVMPMPAAAIPMPTAASAGVPQPMPAYNAAAPTYGNRGGITVSGAEVSSPTAIPAPGMNTMNPAYRTIPPRTVRTDAAGTPAAAPMTRAEAEVHMELLRTMQQQNAQQGRPAGPPLPPTTLTPLLQGN
jgi:hypothetical protein